VGGTLTRTSALVAVASGVACTFALAKEKQRFPEFWTPQIVSAVKGYPAKTPAKLMEITPNNYRAYMSKCNGLVTGYSDKEANLVCADILIAAVKSESKALDAKSKALDAESKALDVQMKCIEDIGKFDEKARGAAFAAVSLQKKLPMDKIDESFACDISSFLLKNKDASSR